MRRQASEEFKALSGAAQHAGVQNAMFGVFHDAGYKGLYGGLGSEAIKANASTWTRPYGVKLGLLPALRGKGTLTAMPLSQLTTGLSVPIR